MKIEITEEKLTKLKPIIESVLSRKYGKEIKFKTLTMGKVTITN